eukprot:s3789_g3.t1
MQTTPHCGSPSELRMALLPEHWPWYALLVQELEGIVKRKAEANQDLNAEQGKSSAEQRRVRKQSTYSGLGRPPSSYAPPKTLQDYKAQPFPESDEKPTNERVVQKARTLDSGRVRPPTPPAPRVRRVGRVSPTPGPTATSQTTAKTRPPVRDHTPPPLPRPPYWPRRPLQDHRAQPFPESDEKPTKERVVQMRDTRAMHAWITALVEFNVLGSPVIIGGLTTEEQKVLWETRDMEALFPIFEDFDLALPLGSPEWAVALNAMSLASGVFYLLLCLWLAMYASISAQSFGVRLLTCFIRLPIASQAHVAKATATAVQYEGRGVPVLQAGAPRESTSAQVTATMSQGAEASGTQDPTTPPVDRARSISGVGTGVNFMGPLPSSKGFIGNPADTRSPKILQRFPLPRTKDNVMPTAMLDHIRLYRRVQLNWQAYDAYARVSLFCGANSLLYSCLYWALGSFLGGQHAGVAAICVALVFATIQVMLTKLDLRLRAYHLRRIALLLAFTPFATTAGRIESAMGFARSVSAGATFEPHATALNVIPSRQNLFLPEHRRRGPRAHWLPWEGVYSVGPHDSAELLVSPRDDRWTRQLREAADGPYRPLLLEEDVKKAGTPATPRTEHELSLSEAASGL